jgi:hypothetical protein
MKPFARLAALAAEPNHAVTDPLSFLEYGVYFVAALAITLWVGRTLFRSGRAFLVDAFHGNQESTLQTVPFKEFTLRAEPLLLVLWTITFPVHQFIAHCSHWVLMRLQPSLSVLKTTYHGC